MYSRCWRGKITSATNRRRERRAGQPSRRSRPKESSPTRRANAQKAFYDPPRADAMGILFSCCRKSKASSNDYKKLESKSVDDLEAGGGIGDDDEEWDEFPEVVSSSAAPAVPEEPEPEPEPDPFAEMGMGLTLSAIKPTKRHVAQSVWAQPAAPTSNRFAMTPDTDAATDAWGDDDLADLGVNEKRRAAEQRREQRRRQREDSGVTRDKPRGLAATRVAE